MTTINLTQFFFGRRKRKKNKGGGGVPTPSLPNAGKPKVSAFNYDKDTRKVTVVASVDRAGEVKTPIGDPQEFPLPPVPSAGSPLVQAADFAFDKDAKKVRLRASNPSTGEVKNNVGAWQEFPIEVPEPTPLPDAGKPFVESVTYDPDTKNVKVRAKVAQAGEVKDPIGEEQEFPIHVPTPPAPPATSLPDAGAPYVAREDFSFDYSTHTAIFKCRVSKAGEVKEENVVGPTNYFPIKGIPIPPKGIIHQYNLKNSSGQELLLDFGGEGGTILVNKLMVNRTTQGVYFAGVNADLYSLPAKFDGDDLKSTGKFSVTYKASGKPAKMIVTADTKWTLTKEKYILVEQSFEVLPE